MEEFAVCQNWESSDFLTLDMVQPQNFMDDHVRLAREGEVIDDGMIRGACPTQVAVSFLPAMLGNPLRILPQNILGDDRKLSWDEAFEVGLDAEHPWYRKYMRFIDALVERAAGRFPVSHGPEIGPADLHAILRGHNESIKDLMDEPEKSAKLLWHLGEIVRDMFEGIWQRIPLFQNGYFDAQYCLWSPGPIIRIKRTPRPSIHPICTAGWSSLSTACWTTLSAAASCTDTRSLCFCWMRFWKSKRFPAFKSTMMPSACPS